MRQVVRAKSFTCFTLHRLVRFFLLVLVCWGGLCLLCVVWFVRWPICAIVLSIDDYFSITPWLPLLLQRAQLWPKKNLFWDVLVKILHSIRLHSISNFQYSDNASCLAMQEKKSQPVMSLPIKGQSKDDKSVRLFSQWNSEKNLNFFVKVRKK